MGGPQHSSAIVYSYLSKMGMLVEHGVNIFEPVNALAYASREEERDGDVPEEREEERDGDVQEERKEAIRPS